MLIKDFSIRITLGYFPSDFGKGRGNSKDALYAKSKLVPTPVHG